jgi:hypothetical protein
MLHFICLQGSRTNAHIKQSTLLALRLHMSRQSIQAICGGGSVI